jgi:agmatine deiminase
MVARDEADAAEARAALDANVEVLQQPVDDSWLRDSGPIFVVDQHDEPGRRVGVHFGFNAWGDKFEGYENDQAIGRVLTEYVGSEVVRAPLVLEGGSIAVDGAGVLLTTAECLLNPNRNPSLTKDEIEQHLKDYLGATQVVWLENGLVEDKDTDGHVDLIAAFTPSGEVLLQSTPPGTPSHERMAENRSRLEAAGLDVVDFPVFPAAEVGGEPVAVSHMNLYLCNGGAVVPVAGVATDAEALERIGAAYPERDVVGVPGAVIAWGGGGPHCITQQVPAARA